MQVTMRLLWAVFVLLLNLLNLAGCDPVAKNHERELPAGPQSWLEAINQNRHWPCQDVTQAMSVRPVRDISVHLSDTSCVDITIFGYLHLDDTDADEQDRSRPKQKSFHNHGGAFPGQHGNVGPIADIDHPDDNQSTTETSPNHSGHPVGHDGRPRWWNRKHHHPPPPPHHHHGPPRPYRHREYYTRNNRNSTDVRDSKENDNGRNNNYHFTNTDVSEEVVHVRRRRSHRPPDVEVHCLTTNLDVYLVSALASNESTYVSLNENFRQNLSYADSVATILRVGAGDKYLIQHRNQTMEYALSSRQHGLPCNGELYICVDESIKAKLRLKLALFYPTPVVKLRQEKKVTMFIYSSLRLLGMERSGVDVLLFSPHQAAAQMPALFRIATFLTHGQEAEGVVPEGDYIVKVVRHGTVTNHCGFQRVNSYLPIRTFHMMAGNHYFLTLLGSVNITKKSLRKNRSDDFGKGRYPARFKAHPAEDMTTTHFPKANLIVINSFRNLELVSFKLAMPNFRIDLKYGEAEIHQNITIKQGDCYLVRSNGSKVADLIFNDLGTSKADCLVVPDHNSKGELDVFFHCFDRNEILPPPGYAEIVVYHALDGPDCQHVDVLLKTRPHHEDQHPAVFVIASNLTIGYGSPRLVKAGSYDIKVTSHGKVSTIKEFDKAVSLVAPVSVYLKSQQAYYASLQGSHSPGEESDFPPMFNILPHHHQLDDTEPTSSSFLKPRSSASRLGQGAASYMVTLAAVMAIFKLLV